MNLSEFFPLAARHIGGSLMSESALIALNDAASLYSKGREGEAWNRMLASLRYSVGVFHPDYQMVNEAYQASKN
jgi:hypothetical protein